MNSFTHPTGTPRGTRASIAPGTPPKGRQRPQRSELPSDTNRQVTGHVRVCAPFRFRELTDKKLPTWQLPQRPRPHRLDRGLPPGEQRLPETAGLDCHRRVNPGESPPRSRRTRPSTQPFMRHTTRTWGLTAQHRELVTEDQDLQVLGGIAAREQGEELDGATQRQVGKFRQHKSDLCGGWQKRHHTERWSTRIGSSQATSEFAHPSGLGAELNRTHRPATAIAHVRQRSAQTPRAGCHDHSSRLDHRRATALEGLLRLHLARLRCRRL